MALEAGDKIRYLDANGRGHTGYVTNVSAHGDQVTVENKYSEDLYVLRWDDSQSEWVVAE